MADTKVSALNAATSIADADLIYVVQGGVSKKSPASLVRATLLPLAGGVMAGNIVSGSLTPYGAARFEAAEAIAAHAHYGFLDNSVVDYSGVATQGHASFNDNVKITGVQNSNHHKSFQATPLFEGSGVMGSMSMFASIPRMTGAGTITSLIGLEIVNPDGSSGVVTTQYGVLINPLTRGAANWALYVAPGTRSYMGGPFECYGKMFCGPLDNAAAPFHQLDVNGDLKVINGMVRLGNTSASDVYDAMISYNANGNLDITPRTNYFVNITQGSLGINTDSPTSKLHVVGLAEYADNAAALSGGLTTGAFYRTGDIVKVAHA